MFAFGIWGPRILVSETSALLEDPAQAGKERHRALMSLLATAREGAATRSAVLQVDAAWCWCAVKTPCKIDRYIHIYLCIYVRIYAYIFVCIHSLGVHIEIYTCVCMHTCGTHIWVCRCI